jgi:hypothetical protein
MSEIKIIKCRETHEVWYEESAEFNEDTFLTLDEIPIFSRRLDATIINREIVDDMVLRSTIKEDGLNLH